MTQYQKQNIPSTNTSYQVCDSNPSVQIFADPIHNQGFDYSTLTDDDDRQNLDISVSDDNDENRIIDTDLPGIVDPIEQLLMSSSGSFNDLETEFGGAVGQHVFPDSTHFYYSQSDVLNSSPTYNNALMMDNYFTDNESIYQMYQDTDCNSLHDYSSISNIIYTKKIKEKLRRKRHASSVDLTLMSETSPKPPKVFKTPSSSNLTNSRRQNLRSKSVGAIALHKDINITSTKARSADPIDTSPNDLSSGKGSGSSSPTNKATNPFYHPPEILKRLTNP